MIGKVILPIRPSSGGGPSPSGRVYQFGRVLWTGQTTVYRTGDEGTLHANGWFDYTPPSYPASFAGLTDFFTLSSNNIHGNTTRFTNQSGGAPATSGNRIIQDHLTGLEWLRYGTFPTVNWNTGIDNALAETTDGGGWYMPPMLVMHTIIDLGNTGLSWNGINLIASSFGGTWGLSTSTTRVDDTTGLRRAVPSLGWHMANLAKTGDARYLLVRKFL